MILPRASVRVAPATPLTRTRTKLQERREWGANAESVTAADST